jgi:hypothetical protein
MIKIICCDPGWRNLGILLVLLDDSSKTIKRFSGNFDLKLRKKNSKL